MSQEITTAFVKQFTNGIQLLQQQMGSNLRRACYTESNITGDRAFFDQVDATAMTQITTRHGDTTLTDTPHKRRMVTLAPYEVADLVDRSDRIRTLNDPTNPYVRSFAAAAGRQIDDTIITALGGTAATGVDGSGSQAFDTTNMQVDTSTNMKVEVLRQMRKKLEEQENEEDGDTNEWFVVVSANQRESLLSDSELTSSDYNTVKALVDGQINQYMGFTFLKSERLPKVGDDRYCYAWNKSCMALAIGQEPRGFIDVLPGKRHSTQIRYETDIGAVRLAEKGVVRALCDETA